MFLKTYNVELDDIIVKFTDQNCRALEIKDKISLALLIYKYKCIILCNQDMSRDMNIPHLPNGDNNLVLFQLL